jgi:hypothetical protein
MSSTNIANYKKGHVQSLPFPTDPSGSYPLLKGDLVFQHTSLVTEPTTVGTGVSGPQAGEGLGGITVNTYNNGALQVYPVRNAAALGSYGTLIHQQEAFAKYFAGVSMRKTGQQSGETLWQLPETIDPGYTLIGTSGIFEYPCPPQVWYPGQPVAIYCSATGGVWSCSPQMVDAVGGYASVTNDINAAIGVAVLPFSALGQTLNPQFNNSLRDIPSNVGGTALSSIWVDIRPAILYRNLQAQPTGYGSGQ